MIDARKFLDLWLRNVRDMTPEHSLAHLQQFAKEQQFDLFRLADPVEFASE